ncbi:GNAT family N-acetyltransferase [bacterium]|nr:MAG: GNAT family N-acetyltransferase [bacterium]
MEPFEIRPATTGDYGWIQALLSAHWGSCLIISRGRAYRADQLPGFIVTVGDKRAGLLTYSINGPECEIVTLNSLDERQGAGSGLLKAVVQQARAAACRRVCLVTTNDNLKAVHFYQKRGFSLVALHRNAIEASRRLKPEIPLLGIDSIPIRDELELEMALS